MNLSENLSNSFEYAKKLFGDAGRLVILIILDLIPIVNLIVIGYGARVLKEAPGSETPPVLERYGDLFIGGVKIVLASLIYMIVPLILIGSGTASLVLSVLWRGDPDFMRGMMPREILSIVGPGLVLVLVGIVLAFLIMIFLGAAIAHMTKTGEFGKAFAFSEILGVIRRIGWGSYLGWIILVVIISVLIGAVTGSIPYLGWLVRAIISPAVTVFFFRSLGTLYSEPAAAT